MPILLAKIALLGVIIPLNLPIFRWAWRICFGTMEEFEACVQYLATWSIVSLFRFELHHDAYAWFKTLLFLGICVGVVLLEAVGLWLIALAFRDIFLG